MTDLAMQTSFHVHSPTCGCPAEVRASGETDKRPRVVIVGAGFGGLSAARSLAKANVRVTLVDRRNHHLFQPLLYQVATAGLSPSQIATPIRTILRRQRNAEVLLGTVTGVDTERRHVVLGNEHREHHINYDYLVLATGARHSYFGRDEWEEFAPGLKSLEDAIELRKRVLLAFERAELEQDEEARRRLLTFVVIGAGPTGVEMAGAIAELARRALASDFRSIDPRAARVILVEAGPRTLATFPEELSAYTEKALTCLGVELMLSSKVTGIDAHGVTLDGARMIPSACVVWAAGVAASPVAKWLNVEADRAGRVSVQWDLSMSGQPDIFVIGDCALAKDHKGRPLPGLAPVAKQQGEHVGKLISKITRWRGVPRPVFRYKDYGALATIGRKIAIADFGKIKLRGLLGWLMWCLAHIYFLIGFRNRFSVAIDWAWSYLTFERGARLITGSVEVAQPAPIAGSVAERRAA
jgi:NADH:ubiquinone reductase (H+-translocating)